MKELSNNPEAIKCRERRARRRQANPEEYLAKQREYKARYGNTEQGKKLKKSHVLKHLYGITLADYELMLEAQGGVCAICGSDTPGRNHKFFCVDHNHHTGNVRGLLCNDCNVGIGRLGDTSEKIRRVLSYLEGHELKEQNG